MSTTLIAITHCSSYTSHRPPSRCLSLIFTHNANHLYALPLLPVTPACSFGDLTRSRSLNLTRSAYQINALSLLYVTPAPEPVPLPHSKNEFLKKPLNQVQGDISCVCRILQSTSISYISSYRINAYFSCPQRTSSLCTAPLFRHATYHLWWYAPKNPYTGGAKRGKLIALANHVGSKPDIERTKQLPHKQTMLIQPSFVNIRTS